jgi:sugar phosphate isomerase/epimerase
MRFGILTHYAPKILDYVAEIGYEAVALSASPGSPIDAEKLSEQDVEGIKKECAKRNLSISTVGFYPNHLNGFFMRTGKEHFDVSQGIDYKSREKISSYFMALIRLASKLGCNMVSSHAGCIPGKTLDEMVQEFQTVFTPYMDLAEKEGVKVVLENCPHGPGGGNFVHSPAMWDRIFTAVPSKNLGIELDPSHMIILFIDYLQAMENYGDRIYHVHLKDAELLTSATTQTGVRNDESWWRYRIPGWGSVDWKAFFSVLHTVGYKGTVVVENEDRLFEGTDIAWMETTELSPLLRRAYYMAYEYLRPLIFSL